MWLMQPPYWPIPILLSIFLHKTAMLYVLTVYKLNCIPSQKSHTKDPWCDCTEDRSLEIIEVKGRLVKMGPTPRLVLL